MLVLLKFNTARLLLLTKEGSDGLLAAEHGCCGVGMSYRRIGLGTVGSVMRALAFAEYLCPVLGLRRGAGTSSTHGAGPQSQTTPCTADHFSSPVRADFLPERVLPGQLLGSQLGTDEGGEALTAIRIA